MEENEQHHLSVGTEVSAKYRGAFCEAKIKSLRKCVVFRVSNKKDGKTYNLNEDSVKGQLRIGSTIEAQFPDQTTWSEGVIISARDKSSYTVEFDDGDVRTLQRSSLCLQGVRHFAESETLDHLPLTDPENFGTPVLSSKRKAKRKTPQTASANGEEDNDSDYQKALDKEPSAKRKLVTSRKESKDEEEDNRSEDEKRKKWLSDSLMGKLVLVEPADKRKHWYPGVCVNPICYEDWSNLTSSQIAVRSFKNGKLFAVERCNRLTRNNPPSKVDTSWKDVLESAFTWEETGMIPDIWRSDIKDILDDDAEESDGSDKAVNTEETEKSNDFLEQLYKFMEDRGTPMNKTPVLGYKDLDLFLLYSLVQAKGGFHDVTEASVWREIYCDLGIPKVSQAAGHHAKQAYAKYLLSFEEYLMSFKSSSQKERRPRRSDPAPPSQSLQLKNKERKWMKTQTSGRVSPLTRSDEDQDSSTRRSNRRRKISETVTDESDITTPPKETKRGRRNKADADAKRDSDMDDSSSTASSEKSTTTRGRLASLSETQKAKINDRRRSNSGTRRKGLVYKPGDKLRVKYGKDSFKLYSAKVVDVDFDDGPDIQYYVHYNGWNSRHDEWIKGWQIAGCITDNDPPAPGSPAPGRSGRRPKTPTLAEAGDKKRNSSPALASPALSRDEFSAIGQALNFSTPPAKGGAKEEQDENLKKKVVKQDADAPKKPVKCRTRRQSTSSSSQGETAPCAKRAASEEKVLCKKTSEIAPNPKEASVKSEEKTSSGRDSPSLGGAARRMSNRRSKSPAYLKESSPYLTTKRKRTTSTTSLNKESPPPATSPLVSNPPEEPDERVSGSSKESLPSSSQSCIDPPSSEKSPVENPPPLPPAEEETKDKEQDHKEEHGSPEVKEEEQPEKEYDDFEEEAPKIAPDKGNSSSLVSEDADSKDKEESDKVESEPKVIPESNLADEDHHPDAPPCLQESDDVADQKSSSSANTTDNEDAVVTDHQLDQDKEGSDESTTSDENSSSDNSRRPSDDANALEQHPLAAHASNQPPPNVQHPRVPLPDGAPSSSKVLVENTPPTTPEASPNRFYDDQDTNGESDNAGSGASSLSGEVPASSSPDYLPKDEEPCEDDVMRRDVSRDDASAAQKRKSRKGQNHRRSSGKGERRKARKSAAGDSETDDEAPSRGKSSEGTPSKNRRRPGKRKAKSKPAPPSAPPPVIGAELAKMDPDERIRVLQAKLSEMRKVYQQLKQEVSSIDRKRKRAKRKEQEAAEMTSPSTPKKHAPSSPSKRDLEDPAVQSNGIEADIAAVNGASA